MMPFIVSEKFETCKLPEFVKPYWPLIKACIEPHFFRKYNDIWPKRGFPNSLPCDIGKVYYLTIQESMIGKSKF